MFRLNTRKLTGIFDMFTRKDNVHSHDTRQWFHLHVPLPKTNSVKSAYVTLVQPDGIVISNLYLLQFGCLQEEIKDTSP